MMQGPILSSLPSSSGLNIYRARPRLPPERQMACSPFWVFERRKRSPAHQAPPLWLQVIREATRSTTAINESMRCKNG